MIYSSFPEKKDEPKVWTFRPTLTTRFLLKMAEMEKNITSTGGRGDFSHWAIQICQNQGSISFHFFWKSTITFL